MATEKEKQTIDEIEKTVEELRRKIESLTQKDQQDTAASGNDGIKVEYQDEFNIPHFDNEAKSETNEKVDTDPLKDVAGNVMDMLGKGFDTVKSAVNDFTHDPKVADTMDKVRANSLKALDQLKDTLSDLKTNPNVTNAADKANDAFKETMKKVNGFVASGMDKINANPDAKKVLDFASDSFKKATNAVNDFVSSEPVQIALDKAKDGAVNATQALADFDKKTLKPEDKE